MTDDVILNKINAIEYCLKRIKQEYQGHEEELAKNETRQDAILLNIQRACESAIDLGAHIVRMRQLGVPQNNRDVFAKLAHEGLITNSLSEKLQNMVGFRNIAIHEYQDLNLEILRSVLDNHLKDFADFCRIMMELV